MRHIHRRLRPVEEDLLSILAQFTTAVSHGAQPSFATFKDIWVKRHFSWIFLGNNTDLSSDKFVQSLYAIVLDCLDIPIGEPPDSRQPSPEAAQQQTAPEQAGVPHNQPGDPQSHVGDPQLQADHHRLHEILLGDDPDPDIEPPGVLTEADITMGTDADTGPHLTTADDPAVVLASVDQAEGNSVEDLSQHARLCLSHVSQPGTTLGHAGMEQHNTSQLQNGGEAHQAEPALLLPPPAQLPPQLPATDAAAAGASHSHSLTCTPHAAGHAPNDRPPADPTLAGASVLDTLPDASLGSPPSLGPQNQLPPPSSYAPMMEAETHLNSARGISNLSWQDPQQPITDTSAAVSKPTSTPASPTQGGAHPGGVLPHLFMTEADLLLDSPGPPPQLVPQPPPGSEGSEAASAGTVGTAPNPGSLQVHSVSAASLAARAVQRQQTLPATATILPPPPAPAPPPAPPAPRPPVLTRVYTKTTAHRRRPHPAKVPLVTKLGSLYAVYCLHETQPGKVPVYLPLELLHQLLEVVKEVQQTEHMPCDVVQVVAQLMHKKAFVVGAIRRPPRDSAADEASFQPPNRMAASSLMGMDAKARTQRDAVYHIQSMYRGLTLVGRLQGLCREYKQAKARAWRMAGVRGKPQSFANLTVGAKLAQLLHRATVKITPKIRPKKAGAGRPTSARQRQQQQQQASPPDPQAENDHELDNLLESGFLELASDDETPAARGAGPTFSPPEADSAEEGEISGTDSEQGEGAGEDDIMPGGLMGLGFGIDFAEVASSGQQDEGFGGGVLGPKLAPNVKRALERDRGRKRRRHLAEKGWDLFEKQLEQHPLGEFDINPDISPGTHPNTDDDDSDFGPKLLAASALDKLVNSPPPSRPPPKRGKRVRFSPDDETCQAGATLTGLGAVPHSPRADSSVPEDATSNGDPAQQQQQQKKKPGRPKGSKNKRKAEAVSEAAGAAPVPDSAPKGRTAERPSAKKRKKASAAGPADPSELLHRSGSVTSPVRASSSRQAPMPSAETSVSHDRGQQSGSHTPPRSSSLHALAASIAASVRLPPHSKQQPAQQAQQPAQQAKQPAKQAQQPAKQAQQPLQQLQEHLQHQPMEAVMTTAAGAAPANVAAKPDTEYLHSAMATIHALLERSDSD